MKTAFFKSYLPLNPRRFMFLRLTNKRVFLTCILASTYSLFLAKRGGVNNILSAPNSKLAKTKTSLAINQSKNLITFSFKNNKAKLLQLTK